MELRYLGTATISLSIGGVRFLTDPAFDPAGTQYDFGPWYAPRSWFASEKTYQTPDRAEPIDAFLVSHDQHADNLDYAGRKLVSASAAPVITTLAGAHRMARPAPSGRDSHPGEGLGLAARVRSLAVGASTQIDRVTITATPARHGPVGTPQIDEVIGFLIEAPGEPTVWISGDTVLYPRLQAALTGLRETGKRIDVAVIHCGAVKFPRLPLLGKNLFTFDAAQATAAARIIDPGLIIPIHRSGWTHFRQPEAELRATFGGAEWAQRTRFLELGESLEV